MMSSSPKAGNLSDVTLYLIDKLEQGYRITDHEKLNGLLHRIIAAKFGERQVANNMARLGIETDEKLEHVLRLYETLVEMYPEMPISRSRMAEAWDSYIKQAVNESHDTLVMDLIQHSIADGVTDRYDILSIVCDSLENKLGSEDALERYLKSVCMSSTKNMMNAIDLCIANHNKQATVA